MTVLGRATVAALAAVSICAAGYVAFIISIHKSAPFLTAVQWLGLPVLSLFASRPVEHSTTFYNLTVALGGVLWFMLVFVLLPRRHGSLGSPTR